MDRLSFSKFIIALVIIGLMSISCERSDLLSPEEQVTSLKISLSGLNNPAPNARYVLWAVYDSAKIELYSEIDSFKVDGDGQLINMDYDINLGVLQKMHTLLVSMETEDTIPQPSDYKVLAAKVKANLGTFSVGDDYLLKFDVANAKGIYRLIKAENSDKITGIWFVKGDSVLKPGLDLPKAKGLWKYSAYIVKDGKRYDMGDFVSADGADGSDLYGAPSFAFPGENFLKDPESGGNLDLDLRGAEVYVEIIPPTLRYDADGDGKKESYPPFELIMFKGQIPQDAQADTEYELTNNSATFPGGSMEININLFK
ncbi:MAG: hypothetical protein GXO77_13425 [Calditrichaeota bacterium]|nr:hypothetical protein [Calditrichota bacterium]